MPAKPRALIRIGVTVAAGAAAGSLAVLPSASAVTSPTPLNDTRRVGAAPVEVDFPIEHFGLVADLPAGRLHPRGSSERRRPRVSE